MTARNSPRSHLTAAERTAQVLRSNASSRFSVPMRRDPNGINTVALLDKDKTQALRRASI